MSFPSRPQCITFWWLLPAGHCTMAQSSNHLQMSWTWHWVQCTQMSPTISRSQCNRAPLMWWRVTSWMCSWKPVAYAWCYHVNMDYIHWRIFPAPFWLHAMKNLVLKAKRVPTCTSRVYLIKWPLIVFFQTVLKHTESSPTEMVEDQVNAQESETTPQPNLSMDFICSHLSIEQPDTLNTFTKEENYVPMFRPDWELSHNAVITA